MLENWDMACCVRTRSTNNKTTTSTTTTTKRNRFNNFLENAQQRFGQLGLHVNRVVASCKLLQVLSLLSGFGVSLTANELQVNWQMLSW